MKITLTAVLLFTLIFSSCKKEEPEMTDRGYSYFPYRVGSMHIYDVDSTVYDDFDTSVTTYKYQLREIIESTIVVV